MIIKNHSRSNEKLFIYVPSGNFSLGGSSSLGGSGGSNFFTIFNIFITFVINPSFPPAAASSCLFL
jgi:hypothetical protein